jgi:hypothetical protein
MPLQHREANPLAVFGMRMMDHCPPHFSKVKFNLATSEKVIIDWIWEHLDGRFYYGDDYQAADGGTIYMQKLVAFELPGEASYFALMLDTFNSHVW